MIVLPNRCIQIKNPKSTIKNKKEWLPWLAGLLVIAVLIALWIPLSSIGTDPAVIRVWIEQLGPLAPLVFFLLNVVQIVVAPIPGYPVQVLGGILFGLIPGAIITVAGLTTMRASLQPGHRRESSTQRPRSTFVSLGRLTERLRTPS